MVMMGQKHVALQGVKETEYLPAKMTIQVADNRTIRVISMAILKITTVNPNRMTRQQVYILEGNDRLYLSQQALWDLSCLLESYPEAEVNKKKGKLGQVTEREKERPRNCPNRALPTDSSREMPGRGSQEPSLAPSPSPATATLATGAA